MPRFNNIKRVGKEEMVLGVEHKRAPHSHPFTFDVYKTVYAFDKSLQGTTRHLRSEANIPLRDQIVSVTAVQIKQTTKSQKVLSHKTTELEILHVYSDEKKRSFGHGRM